MEIIYSLHQNSPIIDTVTIGFFDGCHLGHRSLLSFLSSRPGTKGVITFDQHPKHILFSDSPILITKNDDRLSRLQQFEFDYLCILPFTTIFANQSAEEFLQFLHDTISPSTLVLGYDSKLGKDQLMFSPKLSRTATSFGMRTIQTSPYKIDDEIVSSGKIRALLRNGDIIQANRFLGYSYAFKGYINRGLGIGSHLGIRTINLLQQDNLLPLGVYACEIRTLNNMYQGVMNLGCAPTVNRNQLCVEAHLFQYSGNLYGQEVTIIPKKFLRKEKVFSSKQALREAILYDIQIAKQYFSSLESASS